MDFILDYAAFLLRAITVLVVIALVLAMIFSAKSKGKGKSKGHLQITNVNENLAELKETLEDELLSKAELKRQRKEQAKADKAKAKEQAKQDTEESKPRVFVLNFVGDIKASATESLRQEITAVLTMATEQDEVVVNLESGGGMVHSYGLASSQLARIRQANIPLTVCVDKVAASGGYMMACIGQRILSAPFAVLGSIGVVAQVPNVHRLLKKNDIDVEILTAGKYKRTLTMLGENTEEGREKFLEDLTSTHQLFKQFVSQYRPQLAIEEIATGEIWFGTDALAKQLVDEIKTSDEYLVERAKSADVYMIEFVQKKSVQQRFGLAAANTVDRVWSRIWERLQQPFNH
ncbi:protease SohB [Pseudomonas sp. F1_0610]|uniref:protease SohB n=1 Tax=Pseudomonas sp. F1_0610 TaxID=3114284 RepID=UPI0039C381F0